jgi:hypothetical protein
MTTGEDAFGGDPETTGIGEVGGGDAGDPETIGQGLSDGSGIGDGHAIAI